MDRVKELEEYIIDIEEECENLSEQNRMLINRIKELESKETKGA